MNKKILGIIGTYRKGGIIDSAVSAVLEGARAAGAETTKVYLLDKHIEFCTNCRTCTQRNPRSSREKCAQNDDMEQLLDEIDAADALVFGSPVNFGTVTAVTKRFIERLLPYVYWPWEKPMPRLRIKKPNKKAIIITSSAAPAWMGRIIMPGALRLLKGAAKCTGAKVTDSLYFGLAAMRQNQKLPDKAIVKAQKAGQKLAS